MGARLWPDILPIDSHALLLLSSGFPKRASGLNSRVPLTVVKQTPELDHATSKTYPTPTSVTAVFQPHLRKQPHAAMNSPVVIAGICLSPGTSPDR